MKALALGLLFSVLILISCDIYMHLETERSYRFYPADCIDYYYRYET